MPTLLPHNQKAHDAIMQSFQDGNKRAAVVHATGTGKSYIIAAVASHFDRVLVVTPRDFIVEEIRKVFDKECGRENVVSFCTYTSLMFRDHTKNGYDLIVLDEFHHVGAKEWGRSATELLADNPEAYILGTSATPIRHSDHHRNMADDMFDGNVVSELTLADAIGTILPTPVYVRSIWDFDKTEQEMIDSIVAIKRTSDWKHQNIELVRRQCLDWKQSKGVPQIIKKYVRPDMRHIIMFAPTIKEGRRMQGMMQIWMHSAGFTDIAFFEMNTLTSKVEDVMRDYRQDNGHTMHIAIAINMLNEGVHIEGVDCIIMLRNTKSPTIVEQQLGRCLTVSTKKSPLVLDFVNNISLVYAFKRVRKNYDTSNDELDDDTPLFNSESTVRYIAPKLPFKIIDECTELGALIKSISHNIGGYTIDELKEIASKYKTRTEWKYSDDKKTYVYARKHGLLAEVSSHMGPVRNTGLTKEECIAEAKKYDSRKAFKSGSPSHYNRMRRMGWMTKDVLPSQRELYSLEEYKEMCRPYSSPRELKEKNIKLYNRIHHKGLLRKCFNIECPTAYTKEMVMKIASHFESRCEFKRANASAYHASCKNGWLNDVLAHMPNKTAKANVTYEDFLDAVSQCHSRKEFQEKFNLIYKYACMNKWLTDKILPPKYKKDDRTDQQIIDCCRKFGTVTNLRKHDLRTYDSARHRGLLKKAFS